jgi:hypothetical protein
MLSDNRAPVERRVYIGDYWLELVCYRELIRRDRLWERSNWRTECSQIAHWRRWRTCIILLNLATTVASVEGVCIAIVASLRSLGNTVSTQYDRCCKRGDAIICWKAVIWSTCIAYHVCSAECASGTVRNTTRTSTADTFWTWRHAVVARLNNTSWTASVTIGSVSIVACLIGGLDVVSANLYTGISWDTVPWVACWARDSWST